MTARLGALGPSGAISRLRRSPSAVTHVEEGLGSFPRAVLGSRQAREKSQRTVCVGEIKLLYGDSAAKIQAMEAAMQLSFDKHCDRK